MNKRTISLIVGLVVICIGVLWFVFDRNGGNSTNSNTSPKLGLHFVSSDDDVNALYESDIHGFSVVVPTTFSLGDNPDRDKTQSSSVFRRDNSDTSDQPNRDTPNQFNTSADDILTIDVSPYGESAEPIFPYNAELISAYSATKGAPNTVVAGEEVTIDTHQAIRTIEADGIDSKGQYYYLESKGYLLVISSDDVARVEIEAIIKSITWK
jgi:hypothetical protein